jgi:Fe-S-cluster containining protein
LPIIPECLACGACCFSLLAAYVKVTGHDHARLAERAEELVWFDGNRAYMRMTGGHCKALRIESASGQFFCSAYATRPEVCRSLARGSAECRGELAAKAERPLLALARRRQG